MTLPFSLAPVNQGDAQPFWDGNQFRIGDECTSILQYSTNDQGWNDDLTEFHEDTAGDHHFIDCASRDHAIQQLKSFLPLHNPTILEVGCSSGFMLKRIAQTFPDATIIGADVVVNSLKKLAETLPNIPLIRFDMMQCPLPDNSVDGVVMLNVLEHIENDASAVQQAYRILKPGGVLVIEVPAGPHLYDAYDKVLMHYRRYKLSDLSGLVEKQGFHIKDRSHLGFFLYPGFWWVKQRNKKLLSESDVKQRQQVEKIIEKSGHSKLMHAIMQLELLAGKFIAYPTGIRCLISCVK